MTLRSALGLAGFSAALALLSTCNAESSEPAPREAKCNLGPGQSALGDVTTSFAFDTKALSDLGLTSTATAAVAPAPQHELAVVTGPITSYATSSECLGLDVVDGHVTKFNGGELRHTGGPTLAHEGAEASLVGFEVRVGAEPRTFDIYDAGGEHLLHGTLPHYLLDSTTALLDVFNVDLTATDALAKKLGVPQLAGYVVGSLSLRGKVRLQTVKPTGGTETPANACDDFSGNVDVALIQMDAVQQRARVGDKVVITPSAVLKNVGTANVPWQARFSGTFPPYNTDQHPFLVWSLYRELGGSFEMLAHSDVKHAFLTINSNCSPGACTIGSVLGLGCEDVYGVGTNSTHLAPRSEIRPHDGTWAHCNFPAPNTPSHFDQVAPFCSQDNNGGTEDELMHRLVASDAELSTAGANYYFAAWYVVRDDINIFNSMGWRKVTPTLSGSTWSFPFATPFRQGSALDAYVDPATPLPTRLNFTFKDPTAGSVQIASTATDLGNGRFRYVYAIQNHDFDPKVSSIVIPMFEGVNVEQPKFSDGDEDASNNWLISSGIGQVTLTAPTVDARLSWGRMVTFSFIAVGAPARGVVRLARSDNGGAVNVKSLIVGGP
ncbi:MAG: hypothetical protein R3B48_15420 [Kofleriaceae bacterium]